MTHPLLVVMLCQVFYLVIMVGIPLSSVAGAVAQTAGLWAGGAVGFLIQIVQNLLPYIPLLLCCASTRGVPCSPLPAFPSTVVRCAA
ncbi:hypothetical protein Nans01_24140 [Nocardiopsis ansamitocini]|uniref:Uncharacterized protein n=1 Tax=Nocardiopsis ansamitocini TaxID=1670832 RepID=A0A9W6UJ26_9ACTN|nr:hypothetical protein Nans01_24140 [Nocardiopsis ansamitocini]